MDDPASPNPSPEPGSIPEPGESPEASAAPEEPGLAGESGEPADSEGSGEQPRVPEMVKSDLIELARILAENTDLPNQIRELFERNLVLDGLSRESYERLALSLQVLLGPAASRIVIESTKILTSDFFTELRKSEDDRVEETIRFLQLLAAVYGPHMKDAFLLSFKYTEDDWRTAEVVAYHRGDSEMWFVEMDLLKYNGERLFLRMSPASAFQLLQTFMNEMGKIPQNTVDTQALARIRESAAEFRRRYETNPADTGPAGEKHLDGYA